MKQFVPATFVLLAVLSLIVSGCGSDSTKPASSSQPERETGRSGHDEAGHDEAGHDEAGHDEAGHDEAGHDEAGHDEAGHDEAGHDEAGHDEAGHDEAGHDEAGHDHGDHAGHMDMDAGQSAMDKMKAGLAKLSPEDAAAAEKQHMCPVSGEMLGTMGTPLKVEVNGQQVWICCPGCEAELRKNPDKYLAKLQQ